MPALPIHDFLAIAADTVMFDVRSPAEYAAGHLPGARSMPLFSNEERAAVGTVYKQQGQLPAITLGLEMVGPKMAGFVRQAQAAVGEGGRVGLYCWRGGMRSGSVGWLLGQAGFQVSILKGGYKAYPKPGTGPTGKSLAVAGGRRPHRQRKDRTCSTPWPTCGEQVIDLEGLAHHKGSAFGGIGQPPQPRVEMFENELATRLLALDPGRPIWLEDESQSIGHVFIYGPFFAQMQAAPLIKLDTVPRRPGRAAGAGICRSPASRTFRRHRAHRPAHGATACQSSFRPVGAGRLCRRSYPGPGLLR